MIKTPIVLLWALFTLGCIWMFVTQILFPAFDSRIPFFPWFRKSRYEEARAIIAADDLEHLKAALARAESAWKINQKMEYVTPAYSAKEKALRRAIEELKIDVKNAEERVAKYTKNEPKEAKEDDGAKAGN